MPDGQPITASSACTPAGSEALSLLGDVAHDIRSPLTSILFLAETLRAGRGKVIGPTQERQLMLIYVAAFELSALADDLADLGRGAGRLLEPRPVAFRVDDVLDSVLDAVRLVAEERGVEVRLPSRAPSALERLGHPAALGRVLLNLVIHALRGAERGFVEIDVRPRSGSQLEFTVRGSCGTVSEAVLELLEQPVESVVLAPARGVSGAVLGVELCRRLLAAMGSALQVRREGDDERYLHFALELPAAVEVEPEVPHA